MVTERGVSRTKIDERPLHQRDTVAKGTARAPSRATPASTAPGAVEIAGPRPRASMLAALTLALGVGAALTVLTGMLVGLGISLGLLTALVAVGGISATSKRHVAGRSAAMVGLLLGLGAVVVGVLSVTGTLPWLTPETDNVTLLRDWLGSHLPWLLPGS